MRIALLPDHLRTRGGTQRQLLHLARCLSEKGHDVQIYSYVYNPEACFLELVEGLDIRSVSPERQALAAKQGSSLISRLRPRFCGRLWAQSQALVELLREDGIRFDMINPHGYPPATWAAVLYARETNARVIWQANDFPYKWRRIYRMGAIARWLVKTPIRFAQIAHDVSLVREMSLVTVVDYVSKRITDRHYGISSKVIRTGLDHRMALLSFERAQARQQFGIPADAVLVFGAGILSPYRRFQDLIKAVDQINDPCLWLLIAGPKEYDPRYHRLLQRAIQSSPSRDRIVLWDRFPDTDQELWQQYASADIFVFPNEEQTWGLAVVEAMSMGLPCIVSTGAGVHEVLEDGRTALLVPPRSPEVIADRIRLLLEDPYLRSRLGVRGKEFVLANYSWQKYTSEMVVAFERVLAQQCGSN